MEKGMTFNSINDSSDRATWRRLGPIASLTSNGEGYQKKKNAIGKDNKEFRNKTYVENTEKSE